MKPRERFLMAIKHQEADRVPQLVRWGKDIGRRLARIFGVSGPELAIRLGNDALVAQVGINAEMEMSVGELAVGEQYTSEWGVTYQRESGFNNPIGHPLQNKEDFETYRFPNPHDPKRMKEVRELVYRYGRDHAIIVDLSSSLCEAAMVHLRGMQEFLVDTLIDPDFAGQILDGLADYYIALGRHAVDEGPDVIRIGDDVGTQTGLIISPDSWRNLVKPRLARMIQAFKKANPHIIILYHSCGDFSPIIGDLADMGVQFLSTMQPCGQIDPVRIKAEFGDRLAFKGGLDTQQLLPHGTPEQVREGVRMVIKAYGQGGGYVFMPAHLLYNDVPTENIWAMLEAVKDYGRYPLQLGAS